MDEKKEAVQRPVFKDERDREIETQARSRAVDVMVAAAELLMLVCLFKGNIAWRGFLGVTLLGVGAALAFQHKKYEVKYFLYVGLAFALTGIGLMAWFVMGM